MNRESVGIIWCSRSRDRVVATGNSRRTGWAFPREVERRLIDDFEGKRVLHLFGGHSRFGTRMDIDASTRPDVLADAWLPPFALDSFDVVVLDPPYVGDFAKLNSQKKNALFRAAGWIARESVVWFAPTWQAASAGSPAGKRLAGSGRG